VTLLTVAVERRPCSNRSIPPARRAHSSKPAARCCSGRQMEQTNRRTDTLSLHRPCRIRCERCHSIRLKILPGESVNFHSAAPIPPIRQSHASLPCVLALLPILDMTRHLSPNGHLPLVRVGVYRCRVTVCGCR